MRCSNELALAILDNIRVGASCQKCQELIRILEFSASFLVSPPPQPLGREEELEIEFIANGRNHAYTMILPQKHPNDGIWGDSELENTSMCREGGISQLHRDQGSCTWGTSGPCPVYLFIWLYLYPFK